MAITTNSNNEIGGKITQALNAGSGVDIHNLAKTLAEAETMPRINTVTEKKAESTVAISGYGVLKASVSSLKTSFEALKNADTFFNRSVYSQQTNRIEAVMVSQAAASAGTHRIKINALARAEQSVLRRYTGSGSGVEDFTSLTQQLNGGSTINFTIVVNGTTTSLNNVTDTPQGIIDAVNANSAATGVKARALNITGSGSTLRIVLDGKTGASNAFTFNGHQTADTNNQLALTQTRSAQNLDVELNGLDNVLRDNNSPTDIIDGVQLNCKVAGDSYTNIVVSEDSSSLETKLNSMVESYNQFVTLSNYLTGETDEDDELAGSLVAEKSTVNLIKNRIRGIIGQTSATASNGLSTLRDLGIQTKLGGEISLNATTYAAVVKDKLSDINTMLTANLTGQDKSDTRDHGLALDITTVLDKITNDQGTIKTKETNVTAEVARYEEELLDLQERLETIKARYLRQFVAMESLVQRNKSTGEYLTGQFKAMENMYSSN
jgi:flagellar hook-associated protein 2